VPDKTVRNLAEVVTEHRYIDPAGTALGHALLRSKSQQPDRELPVSKANAVVPT
jgi:hypothetical protein